MTLQEIEYVDWINLAQDRKKWWALVYTVMNLRVPQNGRNFLTSSGNVNFLKRSLVHEVSYLITDCHCTDCDIRGDEIFSVGA